MRVKQLLTDDDAVSPVIGVILMVAITVILAAVIAAFVLGLGDTEDPAPQVSFDTEYDSGTNGGEVVFTVQSGDNFDADNVDVTNQGTGDTAPLTDSSNFGSDSTVGAGDSFTVNDGTNGLDVGGVSSGNRVDITFTPDDGGDASIIKTFNAPDN
jgi:flagellin-like protein